MITINPIKTEADYEATLARVEELWGSEPDTPEGDELEVLFTLVEAYEAKHYPIAPPDPIEAIKFEMENRGLTRKDLERYLGNREQVSEVLNHQRSLSIKMIRNLHKGLGIPLVLRFGNQSDYSASKPDRSSRPVRFRIIGFISGTQY
jgi:HTH-type transcriptional regulator/antitoxin HigA